MNYPKKFKKTPQDIRKYVLFKTKDIKRFLNNDEFVSNNKSRFFCFYESESLRYNEFSLGNNELPIIEVLNYNNSWLLITNCRLIIKSSQEVLYKVRIDDIEEMSYDHLEEIDIKAEEGQDIVELVYILKNRNELKVEVENGVVACHVLQIFRFLSNMYNQYIIVE